MGALISVSKETSKLNVDVKTAYALKQGNKTPKSYFLSSLHYGAFQSLAAICVLQFPDSLQCHQNVVFESDVIHALAVLTC